MICFKIVVPVKLSRVWSLVREVQTAARAKGRVGGRRPKLTTEQWAQIGRLLEAGESRQRIALIFDVGVSTIYRKFPANKSNESP